MSNGGMGVVEVGLAFSRQSKILPIKVGNLVT